MPAKKPPSRSDAVRLRTAQGRSPSQQSWLRRQLNDPYVAAARAEGWRSRAAFKLIELDDKFALIKPGARVIDLGAAPGGWSQVAIKRGAARVVGVDLLAIDEVAGATLIQGDFNDPDMPARLTELMGGPGRSGAVRHGAEYDRPCPHRPFAHHGPGRIGAGFRGAVTVARWRVRDEDVPGWHRKTHAGADEAAFRQRAPRQAAGQPEGKQRAVRGGDRVQGRSGDAKPARVIV